MCMNIDATNTVSPQRQSSTGGAASVIQSSAQTPAAESAASAKSAAARSAMEAAAQQLQAHMASVNSALEFRVDNGTGDTVITVRDKDTGNVIRQIPSEEALRIAENLDKAVSALISARV